MSVLAIIAALVIEQWRPLGDRKAVQGTLAAWASWLEQSFNGGERRHGMVAWLVAVLPPVLLAYALHAVLYSVHPLLALAFNVAVLYLTLGFRQFSHYFTDIQLAIKAGDLERARALLAHAGAQLVRSERRHRARGGCRRHGRAPRHAGAGGRRHAAASRARRGRAGRGPVPRQHRRAALARRGGLGVRPRAADHRAAV